MKNKQNIKAAENVLSSGRLSFILFSAVLILIPLSFWRGFENSFDLVKAAVIYTTGGLFIFFTALGRFKDDAASVSVDLKLDVIFLAFVLSVVLSAIFSPIFYVSFFGTYERQTGLLLFLSLYIVYLLGISFNS